MHYNDALREIGIHQFDLSEYGKLKVVGTTDEFTSCCCCGKENLKRTVVMQDSNGNYSFFGSSCAYGASKHYQNSKARKYRLSSNHFRIEISPNLKTV